MDGKSMKASIWTVRSFTVAAFTALLVAPLASAQYQYPPNAAPAFDQYKDYPQLRGQLQPLTEGKLPA